MATDKLWIEICQRVEDALFADQDVVNNAPTSRQDWEDLAGTITDHVYATVRRALNPTNG